MGTWGAGSFENDTASDWEMDVLDEDTIDVVDRALDVGKGYLDADDAMIAIAAAELVAAALGKPSADLPPDLRKWSLENKVDLSDRVDSALNALDRATEEESELRGLWAESPTLEDWLAAIEDTRERLIKASGR